MLNFESFDVDESKVIVTGAERPESLDVDATLKFLVLPSFTAGVFLGTNNFFLG